MCPDLPSHKQESVSDSTAKAIDQDDKKQQGSIDQTLANYTRAHVFLQTLRVRVSSDGGSREVRALIDSGSQRSYLLKSTAQKIGCSAKRTEEIVHTLFGGSHSNQQRHGCYDIKLINGNYSCEIEVLDQFAICNDISTVFYGPWMEELKRLNIQISDTHDAGPIELLLGADVVGKLYTGRRYILECGLVVVETVLGWTLMGKIPNDESSPRTALTLISLLSRDHSISDLWELERLGISDPVERKSSEEMALAAKNLFLQTVTVNKEGRYEVRLPWLEDHPPLPDNYAIAKKTLCSTVKKLQDGQLLETYDRIFEEWRAEGIIEEIPAHDDGEPEHFLPHPPVIKESSLTTKIRPVFDASAHEKNKPEGPESYRSNPFGPNKI